jgi:hypothetical protein
MRNCNSNQQIWRTHRKFNKRYRVAENRCILTFNVANKKGLPTKCLLHNYFALQWVRPDFSNHHSGPVISTPVYDSRGHELYLVLWRHCMIVLKTSRYVHTKIILYQVLLLCLLDISHYLTLYNPIYWECL